jgi:hypothetical protein
MNILHFKLIHQAMAIMKNPIMGLRVWFKW